ncbi:MAG: DUF3050 domain-containing protein [Cryomorphaceae bacterium]|nr:DUF3050 domain-containing protein [Cryomorphaceae bacterium]
MMNKIENINAIVAPIRKQIVDNKSYKNIQSPEALKTFMEHHVYAVWDFMSLLKGLQRNLTCVDVPWVPVGDAQTRYLINEIVTGEESDVDENGVRKSHYELYLDAMVQGGADTTAILGFVRDFTQGYTLEDAALKNAVPEAALAFMQFTFSIINSGKPHLMAAVFTFGREDLIPDMFLSIVKDIEKNTGKDYQTFRYYLERHIEVDGDHHSHLAIEMTERLCGDDSVKWEEAQQAVKQSLNIRAKLWEAAFSTQGTNA